MSSSKRSRLSCWMVATRFSTSAESISGSAGLDGLTVRSGLVDEFHGGGIHAEAMEDGAGSVEGQLAVAVDSDDFEDELKSLRDNLIANLRRRRGGEELPGRLAGLGFRHTEKIAESQGTPTGRAGLGQKYRGFVSSSFCLSCFTLSWAAMLVSRVRSVTWLFCAAWGFTTF
jgi:hypothetical protein